MSRGHQTPVIRLPGIPTVRSRAGVDRDLVFGHGLGRRMENVDGVRCVLCPLQSVVVVGMRCLDRSRDSVNSCVSARDNFKVLVTEWNVDVTVMPGTISESCA